MGVDGELVAAPAVPGVELGRLIARGGASQVWEGVREADGRRVAVKVGRGDPVGVEAAVRQASVAAAAAGAHLVPVEATLPLPDGGVALVMPLFGGGSLSALVAARGHLAPGEVVTVLAPVAGALGRLHRGGVVHGDLSPGNVLLDLDGRPALADLGTARVVGEEPAAVWGTDGYVAPEVLLGGDPGPAADVYALGALGWLCLTGSPPGPPGLRSRLADLCRAGDGAAALVEVLEAAVAPHAADRPTADELAWSLFGAADALPLHLVDGEDEVSAVTFRLRAAAAGSPATDEPRHRARHARPPGPRLPGRRLAALLAVAVAAGGGAAATLAVSGPGPVDGSALHRPVPQPAGGSSATTSPAPTRAPVAPTAVPDAPVAQPAALLEQLAEARAAAWRAGDPRLLGDAEAPGSPMLALDTEAVGRLERAGLRYAGLHHVVGEVSTVSATDATAVLRARVGTGRYDVVGSGRPRPGAAVAGEEVLVELVWTDRGWRLAGLRAPG